MQAPLGLEPIETKPEILGWSSQRRWSGEGAAISHRGERKNFDTPKRKSLAEERGRKLEEEGGGVPRQPSTLDAAH